MQLSSNKDIEKSIERAEKCLNENNLDVAERECSLAKGFIETRRANQGNDGDSDVAKLNEFYGRLTSIMAKIAVERMNQGIRNEPEMELDYKYLSQNLAPIQSELYSKHRELIHKHEYEQAGKHSIAERVKDSLTGATKKRKELKERLSKTGYPGIQKIINLTDTMFVETDKERREFLNKQIQQEIGKLPEPYKTAVGSFFREAKKSSVEDKPDSIATEDSPVPIHTENNNAIIPDEDGSDSGRRDLSNILFQDIPVNQKSQSPERTEIEPSHKIPGHNDTEREEYGSKINQLNETMALAENSDDKKEAEALCTWVLGQIKKISKANLNDKDAREIDALSERAKQILQKGGAPVSGEKKLFGMNVAFREIVQDYESGEIENKKAIEAADKIIELLKKASFDEIGAAERDRLVEQISDKITLWKQAGEQNSTGAVAADPSPGQLDPLATQPQTDALNKKKEEYDSKIDHLKSKLSKLKFFLNKPDYEHIYDKCFDISREIGSTYSAASLEKAIKEIDGLSKELDRIRPKLYCCLCGYEVDNALWCTKCNDDRLICGREKNLMDTLLGPSWDADTPKRADAWRIAAEFSNLVKLNAIAREEYPKNVTAIDELLQKLSSKQLEGDAHKSLERIHSAFVENNRKFRNNALDIENGGDVASNYNNPENLNSSENDPAQSFRNTNTTLPFAEKEARDGVLANIYASEVSSAKGEYESAKKMLKEAERLYKSLTNTEGFTEEMNKTTILSLLYAAEILGARGYHDIAKEKINEAEKLYHKIGKDALFHERMAKNDIRALMDASEILQARGFYDLAKDKVIKAENINRGL